MRLGDAVEQRQHGRIVILLVVASSANVSLVKVYTGTSILMIALVLTTVLLMVFPQIALWLPATMK